MFRNWLISLITRPRVPEDRADETESGRGPDAIDDPETSDQAFQPNRSQEEILKEEAEERATSRRNRVISRFFDDNPTERTRSRQ